MDTWLNVMRASEPEVILWENQHVTSTNRLFRFILATFFTFLILMMCLAILSTGQYFEDKTEEEFKTKICENLSVTMDQAYADALLPKDRQAGLLTCYCLS
jgi:hypothetical protein